ncbi:hypothetical protein BDP27DRAFT_1478610 [Rhodocollybia butyracea]|uniref:Uncharacterized protein n=1 Tax=Rhodocollybia butyracea TaxID=206335 RepID=A0A9P5PHB5_9AGAR|nr:hypothetical protein BDP27DRAFT_1478610 [Rhodocollybia butyracea]
MVMFSIERSTMQIEKEISSECRHYINFNHQQKMSDPELEHRAICFKSQGVDVETIIKNARTYSAIQSEVRCSACASCKPQMTNIPISTAVECLQTQNVGYKFPSELYKHSLEVLEECNSAPAVLLAIHSEREKLFPEAAEDRKRLAAVISESRGAGSSISMPREKSKDKRDEREKKAFASVQRLV